MTNSIIIAGRDQRVKEAAHLFNVAFARYEAEDEDKDSTQKRTTGELLALTVKTLAMNGYDRAEVHAAFNQLIAEAKARAA